MAGGWLVLTAYAGSGMAGLMYEVVWTRLLTLYMGHTTAAASTVVAAFMGGLAAGSALGGRMAARFSRRQSLQAYATLEAAVATIALLLPLGLDALVPLLRATYANGASATLFPAVRLIACFALLFVPAVALGATFPFAARWFVGDHDHPGRGAGALYAANAAGAAIGAIGAGFILIPMLGLFGTTLVAVASGGLTIAIVLVVLRGADVTKDAAPTATAESRTARRPRPGRDGSRARPRIAEPSAPRLAAVVLACTGFATLMYEIAWTRILGLVVGPSTYAFAATVTAIIAATAIGAALGAVVAGRLRSAAAPLAAAIAGAALAEAWTTRLAGELPRTFIDHPETATMAATVLHASWVLMPTALVLGVAFPLALELAGRANTGLARRLGTMYALNSIAAVAGSLIAGFVALPALGLQNTLRLTGAVLAVAGFLMVAFGRLTLRWRIGASIPALAAAALLMWSPPWDRQLLSSGAYKYARYAARTADPETSLKAGTLLYYRDGAVATVSVKRLTGSLSLSIDGKVDASTTGDMLTQKLLAHLPLLLHDDPHEIGIIGLGSGVTLASTLVHGVRTVDVIELSPEVVEASQFFAEANHHALADPRTHLIVGDGRTHMSLGTRTYDVIVSEPSNPWMSGVAALFTREFFTLLRNHLAPGGILCQWAHTYDISPKDLQSIVATFAAVFPDGTMWLIGDGDLLLVASTKPLEGRLERIGVGLRDPAIAADLAEVGAHDAFALYSLFVGGPSEMRRYSEGASVQTDNRMALEFSAPRAVFAESSTVANASGLRSLLDPSRRPPAVDRAYLTAGAAQWRDRGAMMLKAGAYTIAYDDYLTAIDRAPTDRDALGGLVRAAAAAHRETEATARLRSLVSAHPTAPSIRVALAKMLAATGRFDEAIGAARAACDEAPLEAAAWEQLASIYADLGDREQLSPVVAVLRRVAPMSAAAAYYAAASALLGGDLQAAGTLAELAIARDATARAYNLLGAAAARRDQTADARRAFESALRLDPRDVSTYINLGLLDLSTGRSEDAAEYFAEALSLDPQSPPALQGLRVAGARTPGR